MIANTFTRLTFSTLVALLLPVIAAAQTSIFVVPLDRTGTPGTTTVTGPDDQVETPWPYGLGAFLLVLLLFHLFVLRGGVSVDPRMWG